MRGNPRDNSVPLYLPGLTCWTSDGSWKERINDGWVKYFWWCTCQLINSELRPPKERPVTAQRVIYNKFDSFRTPYFTDLDSADRVLYRHARPSVQICPSLASSASETFTRGDEELDLRVEPTNHSSWFRSRDATPVSPLSVYHHFFREIINCILVEAGIVASRQDGIPAILSLSLSCREMIAGCRLWARWWRSRILQIKTGSSLLLHNQGMSKTRALMQIQDNNVEECMCAV